MTAPILAVDAWREGRFWVIDVPGVGVTQARRRSQVADAARDLVAQMTQVQVNFR